MVVLGGMGNVVGAVIGAAVLVILPELLRPLQNYRLLIFGLILMAMMIFRPEGIVVSRRRQRELRESAEAMDYGPSSVDDGPAAKVDEERPASVDGPSSAVRAERQGP